DLANRFAYNKIAHAVCPVLKINLSASRYQGFKIKSFRHIFLGIADMIDTIPGTLTAVRFYA
ncbi:MAG: hypothetical protein RLZZ366_339, partial [Pseudomonadota bacterium]